MGEGKIFIGTSGYHYNHWREGIFYPQKLPQRQELEYYSQFFNTVELNVTFYRLPQTKAFLNWYKRTPPNFIFAVKGSRFITHIKRLKDSEVPLAQFFERALFLKEKLGVVLWQLPPKFSCDLKRFKSFLENLKPYGKLRHVFEFRHPSWFILEVYEIIKAFKMSVCYADWPGLDVSISCDFPFIYIRRHGPVGKRLYTGCYSLEEIKKDAIFIKKCLKKGKDVFIYFNNDAFGYAVKNALELKRLIECANSKLPV